MTAYLILSDIHANLDALEAVLDAADGQWDRAARARRPRRLRRRAQRGHRPVRGARARSRSSAATTTRRRAGSTTASKFNQIARVRGGLDGRDADAGEPRLPRALPVGPVEIDDRVEICHGAPFDEDHYIFDADDAHAGDGDGERQLCLFGHTHLPVDLQTRRPRRSKGSCRTATRHSRLRSQDGTAVPDQSRVGRPAARRRSARARYRRSSTTGALTRAAAAACRYPVADGAAEDPRRAGLPASLANRLAVGDRRGTQDRQRSRSRLLTMVIEAPDSRHDAHEHS